MINPLVSVIMPVYNSAKYLHEAVDSVLAQSYAHWELLMVNDCSTDSSAEKMKSFSEQDQRIKTFHLSKNSGAAAARNLAIQNAQGKYIAFLDADDLWMPEKLAQQISYMEQHQNVLSYSWYYTMNPDGSKQDKIIKAPAIVSYEDLLRNNTIGCLTAVYNAELLGKMEMPLIRKRQDYGLWLNILRKGYMAHGIQEPLAIYRTGMDSLSKNKLKVLSYNWELLRRHQQLPFITASYYFLCFLWNKTFKYLK